MTRRVVVAFFAAVSTSGISAQSLPRPAFDAYEVATIKPSSPDSEWTFGMQGAHRFRMTAHTLKEMMVWAYTTPSALISGGPAWIGSARYDLVAETPGEVAPTQQENILMLQKLLADRFNLVIHREPKELSIYALVMGKSGPKLTPTATPESNPTYSIRNFTYIYRAVPMARLAAMLQRTLVDRPVVDKTGLAGKFDFELEFDARLPRPEDSDKPDLFTAIQEQLGLKLEPTKGIVDGIVIDKAERPSEN